MADPEHLKILMQGVKTWNRWRCENPGIEPKLGGVQLAGIDLRAVNLSGADLVYANFRDAKLTNAKFRSANLNSALLSGADICGAELNSAFLNDAAIIGANLSGADLSGADLSGADLRDAYLINTGLRGANLIGTYLNDVNLSHANLSGANLGDANFSGANLYRADLTGAHLCRTYLRNANLVGAIMLHTVFAGVTLKGVKGLDAVLHFGPSEISISTIYLSEGQMPEVFLRSCGVPDSFIVQLPSLVAAVQPIQFYSCFISHSSEDGELAQRLYADLQSRGVRCWFAPEDLKVGERFRRRIDEAIRVHDKLLLILSEHSMASSWVEKEVETALESEGEQKRTILFPMRLDDSVMEVKVGWAADVRRTRHIGDFRRWKEQDEYVNAFERLLRDLKAAE